MDDLRRKGLDKMNEVYGWEMPDIQGDPYFDLTVEHLFGTIWTRPGLDRRSRSMITLTALIARGHHEELAMHVRAARRNGLTVDEIKEILLHATVYCGIPAGLDAFKAAHEVLVAEGAVPKPKLSAPRIAALITSRPVFRPPSVCRMVRSRRSLATSAWCDSATPSSHGTPA